MKNLEIKTIEHKDIKVTVKIDFDKGEVSLVESFMGDFEPKKWVFATRGLEYMNGWIDIIDSMKFAVQYAKKELESDLAEKSKFKDDLIVKVSKRLSKEK